MAILIFKIAMIVEDREFPQWELECTIAAQILIKAFDHDQYNSAFYCTNNNTLIFLTQKIILVYIFLTIILCQISNIRRRISAGGYPTRIRPDIAVNIRE